jgi:hypothetical protein
MDLTETGCEDGRWVELTQDYAKLPTLAGAEPLGSATKGFIISTNLFSALFQAKSYLYEILLKFVQELSR